jgi:hypothetical protein
LSGRQRLTGRGRFRRLLGKQQFALWRQQQDGAENGPHWERRQIRALHGFRSSRLTFASVRPQARARNSCAA